MSNNELALENPRKAVAAVGTELDKMPTPPPDQQAKETWERLVQVVNFVNARLAGTDPALVPVAQANNLNSQLTVLLNATRAFLANASTWRNLEGPLDNTLNAIVAIPPMGAGEASQHYVTAFNEFMRRRDEAIKAAEDRAAAMEKRSKDLQASVKETEKRLSDLDTQVADQKARLDKVIPDGQKRIDDVATRGRDEFAKTARDLKDEFQAHAKEKLSEHGSEFTALMERIRTDAGEHLHTIEGLQKKAEKIVGVVVATAMSGHYQQAAGDELALANRMRWWATGAFVIAAFLVVFVIVIAEFGASPTGWGLMAFRVAMAAVIFVPAFYFARESAGHRRTANRLRRIELELAALEPFLRDLPDAERNEILKKKSDEYFGREVEQGAELDGLFSRYLMLGRITKMFGQLRGIADAVSGNAKK